jgi:hypothetical protein
VVGLMFVPLQLYVNDGLPLDTFAVRFVLLPVPEHHSELPLDVILTTGLLFSICTSTWLLAVHPLLSVTTTVYVVSVVNPNTVGFDTLADDNATDGDQL